MPRMELPWSFWKLWRFPYGSEDEPIFLLLPTLPSLQLDVTLRNVWPRLVLPTKLSTWTTAAMLLSPSRNTIIAPSKFYWFLLKIIRSCILIEMYMPGQCLKDAPVYGNKTTTLMQKLFSLFKAKTNTKICLHTTHH